MFRLSAIIYTILAVGIAAWAIYSAFHPLDPNAQKLAIDIPERGFGALTVGEHPVTLTVTNQSDHPVEIVSLFGGCGSGCCLRPENQKRRSIAPGETIGIKGLLDVRSPGAFAFEDQIYLSDNGELRNVLVKLSGIGIPAEKPNAPPP